MRLVKQFGMRKWSQIAENMVGRAGKQCRERWHNHLRPDIKVIFSTLYMIRLYFFYFDFQLRIPLCFFVSGQAI